MSPGRRVASYDERVDGDVGQHVEVEALRVRARSPRVAVVEHPLQRDIRHGGDHLEQGRCSRARRRDSGRVLLRVAETTRIIVTTGAKWCSTGTNGAGGAAAPRSRADVAASPPRRRARPAAPSPHRPARPQHRELHDRTDVVQPELELGHDAEVAATAAQRPEQVRVLGRLARTRARRRARPRSTEVVDREPRFRLSQPMPPPSVSPPTPVWLTVPPGPRARAPGWRRRPRPSGRPADADPAGRRIDHDVVDPAQIDHHSAVGHRGTP